MSLDLRRVWCCCGQAKELCIFSLSKPPMSPLWHRQVSDWAENPAQRFVHRNVYIGSEGALNKDCMRGLQVRVMGSTVIFQGSLESERSMLNYDGTGHLSNWKKMTAAVGWTQKSTLGSKTKSPSLSLLYELIHSFFTLVSLNEVSVICNGTHLENTHFKLTNAKWLPW